MAAPQRAGVSVSLDRTQGLHRSGLAALAMVLLPWIVEAQIIRLDRSPTGATANGVSFGAVISADGRFAAFTSDATNLVAGDANGRWDFFRYDRQTGTIIRGAQPPAVPLNRTAQPLALSADGRWLLFSSVESGWVAGDSNGTGDVFQFDFDTSLVRRVSVGPGGVEGNGSSSSLSWSTSADGRYVAFSSVASNLGPPELDNPTSQFPFSRHDVFVRDTVTGVTVQVSKGAGNVPADGSSFNEAISPDGEWVAFVSNAPNLTAVRDPDGGYDLYLVRWRTGELWRVVPRSGRTMGFTTIGVPTWDAAAVLLSSSETELLPGTFPRQLENFVWDRASGLFTPSTPFGASRFGVAQPAISLHGRYVVASVPEFVYQGPLTVQYDRATSRTIVLDRYVDLPQMSADGRAIVYTSQVGGIFLHDLGVEPDGLLPWLDEDADGLPNGWEEQFGLDPRLAALDNGPGGDPDLDGLTNAQEYAQGGHPRGTIVRYFAEGAAGAFFDTRVAIANPGLAPAHVLVVFTGDGGSDVRHAMTLTPLAHRTLEADAVAGLRGRSFSMRLESDTLIVAERTMTWDASAYGAHSETATVAPSRTWYFAEGTTSGEFSLFYLLQNPQAVPVTVTARYLRPAGLAPIVKTYVLPANSRTTVAVDTADPALTSTDVALHIEAVDPIVVERAQYLNLADQPFAAGHASGGAMVPSTTWYLAEGATGPFFELFVLLMNPSATTASCTVRYLTGDGNNYSKAYALAPESRTTIWVDHESIPGLGEVLANQAVSTSVTCATVPIVVERTMWWPDGAWQEAHNTVGVTATAHRWAVAGGESGGSIGMRTFVLVANVSDAAGEARVTVHVDDGSSAETTVTLPGSTRTSLDIGSVFGWLGDIRPRRFWVLVEALGPTPIDLIVERATYWNASGITWAAGTSAPGTPWP